MSLLQCLFAVGLLAIAPVGAAQTYPEKDLKLVVGQPAGDRADIVARQLADRLSKQLGQRVVVENKAGASGNVAMELVARSKPDGTTLLLGNVDRLTANPALYPNRPFDPFQNFAAVARVVLQPLVAVVPASLPVRDMTEFLALARAKPGELSFGSSGNGSLNQLAVELLQLHTGTQFRHVSYRDNKQALSDLGRGRIQFMVDDGNVVAPLVKNGRARALLVTAEVRLATLPNVPTAEEAGVPRFVINGSLGVLAPAGTPRAIVERLSEAIGTVLADPKFKQRLSAQGTEPAYLPAREFPAFIAREQKRWTGVIRTAKVRPD